MKKFVGAILSLPTGCANPTGQWLQTLQNSKAEPALREWFGVPVPSPSRSSLSPISPSPGTGSR